MLSLVKKSHDFAEKNAVTYFNTVRSIDFMILLSVFMELSGRVSLVHKERAAVLLFTVFTITAKESKGNKANTANMLPGTFWCC